MKGGIGELHTRLDGTTDPRVQWAVEGVDALHYLIAVDERAFGGAQRDAMGFHPDTVDLAHIRWATGTAITSLDLCAASLGIRYVGATNRALSVRDFDPDGQDKRVRSQYRDLPVHARSWVDAVRSNSRYQLVLQARHHLAHNTVGRGFYRNVGAAWTPHAERIDLHLPQPYGTVAGRTLIQTAAALAEEFVRRFAQEVDGV